MVLIALFLAVKGASQHHQHRLASKAPASSKGDAASTQLSLTAHHGKASAIDLFSLSRLYV